jgi:lauroyl/myristoyl acyltransferase
MVFFLNKWQNTKFTEYKTKSILAHHIKQQFQTIRRLGHVSVYDIAYYYIKIRDVTIVSGYKNTFNAFINQVIITNFLK